MLVSLWAGPAFAQRPTVSPGVARAFQRDSVAALWLFLRPEASLGEGRELVAQAGGRVRRESEWLHALSAEVTEPAFTRLRQSERVRHLQPVARFRAPGLPPAGPVPSPAPSAGPRDSTHGPSAMPFRRLNAFGLADRGFRGGGVRIAILDTGFETQLPAFSSATVIAERDFVFDDDIVRNEPSPGKDADSTSRHGTAVWSLLAADVPGVLIGTAPAAEYILAKTEDIRFEQRTEEDDYVAALEWAHSLGAHIVSSSLGYLGFDDGSGYTQAQLNGDLAITTIAADAAAARGILVLTAAGNEGPNLRTLVTPADGDSVVAVGAEDSLGALVGFSSRGPTADGRIKPDFVAPGVSVWVLDTRAGGGFNRLNGTSFATPLLSGVSALLREVHPNLGPIEIREALKRAGNNATTPTPDRGWGLPDAMVAASFPNGIVLSEPADSVLSGATPTFTWAVPGAPGFALPVSFQLTVSRPGNGSSAVILDTTTSATSATVRSPQRPGTRLTFTLRATAADSASLRLGTASEYVVPPWIELVTLDDPAGLTIREARPLFRWAPTTVASPPGPFTYDLEVIRAGDAQVELRVAGLDSTSLTPQSDLEFNTPYRWRVTAHLGPDTATSESRGVFVIVDESVPPVTLLYQNFPNPFPNLSTGRTTTCVWFDLAAAGRVALEILDLRGHLVRRLIPPQTLAAGRYGRPAVGASGQCSPELAWDGQAEDGSLVARGVYLIKLDTPTGRFFRRAVFLGPP